MHPYRVAEDPGELPPLPLRGLLRPIGAIVLLSLVVATSIGIAVRT